MPIKISNSECMFGEEWVDDAGVRLLNVHEKNRGCEEHGCALHNPTGHSYSSLPLLWSTIDRMFYRVGLDGPVPDPDEIAYRERLTKRNTSVY